MRIKINVILNFIIVLVGFKMVFFINKFIVAEINNFLFLRVLKIYKFMKILSHLEDNLVLTFFVWN
jgi:hypothetical protein